MSEIWKDIKGFEGYYQISNIGNIKSLEKFVNHHNSNTGVCFRKEKILKKFYNKSGYLDVYLYKNNKRYIKKVHRLVGKAFIPNPKFKKTINHIDSNRLNNNINNLEWNTYKENTEHAYNFGNRKDNIPIKIISKSTNQYHTFRSLLKGSNFLSKQNSYLSKKIKKNKFENDEFYWELLI